MARKMKTMDGKTMQQLMLLMHILMYENTEKAAIYPITPSSVMAEATDEWATQGRNRKTFSDRKFR